MKYLRTHDFGTHVCFYPYFSRIMGIHSSHTLRIAWISASREVFKKRLTFEYLCFLKFFLYYGNSFFPCFRNCILCQPRNMVAQFKKTYLHGRIKILHFLTPARIQKFNRTLKYFSLFKNTPPTS